MRRRWFERAEGKRQICKNGGCRDRTEIGLERYLALGILGRNLHVLGRLLIAQQAPKSLAGQSLRKAA